MMGAGFLTVQEAGGPRSQGGTAGFAEVPSLVYRRPPLPVSSGGGGSKDSHASPLLPRWGPTLMTLVILNHPFKGPTSKHSHMGS